MIQNIVYKLINEFDSNKGIAWPAGQEFEIVMDVVYVNGYPLGPELQSPTYNWIQLNPKLFKDVTKNW